jgi:hypothetical protein
LGTNLADRFKLPRMYTLKQFKVSQKWPDFFLAKLAALVENNDLCLGQNAVVNKINAVLLRSYERAAKCNVQRL